MHRNRLATFPFLRHRSAPIGTIEPQRREDRNETAKVDIFRAIAGTVEDSRTEGARVYHAMLNEALAHFASSRFHCAPKRRQPISSGDRQKYGI
jgi:hypothetical protein